MQKPWLRHYPEGVPAEINTGDYQSLVDLLDSACRRYASRRAATFMGCDLLFKDLDAQAGAVAGWIQQQGLPRGSRIALMMPNLMAYMPIMLGVLRAGMVVVNVNPMYKERELEHQLSDSDAALIFIFEKFASTLAQVPAPVRPKHVVLVSLGDLMGFKGRMLNVALRYVQRAIPAYKLDGAIRLSAVLKGGAVAGFTAPVLAMSDVAILQYTGGTTGVPKGAMLTHGNLVANVLQVEAVAIPVLADASEQSLNMLTALPLYHIFALTVCGLFAAHAGMCSVLIVDPRNLASIIKAWRRDSIPIDCCDARNA